MHKIIFLNFIRTRKQQSSISHHFKALPSIRWSWNIILAIDHSFLPLCFIVKHESWCWCCFQFLAEIPAWITFVFLFCASFWDSRERKLQKDFGGNHLFHSYLLLTINPFFSNPVDDIFCYCFHFFNTAE